MACHPPPPTMQWISHKNMESLLKCKSWRCYCHNNIILEVMFNFTMWFLVTKRKTDRERVSNLESSQRMCILAHSFGHTIFLFFSGYESSSNSLKICRRRYFPSWSIYILVAVLLSCKFLLPSAVQTLPPLLQSRFRITLILLEDFSRFFSFCTFPFIPCSTLPRRDSQ